MVLRGFGLVNAYTLAAAVGSAMQLNSPRGVILPGVSMAPPITSTAFARMKILGSVDAAMAKFVKGPIAIRVTVLGGLVERIWRISSGEAL